MSDTKYIELLQQNYKNKEMILSELTNLEAILTLPKGTELFISDIHGEYDSFNHILRTGSGIIKEKVYALFEKHKSDKEKDFLCLLIAYPKEMLNITRRQLPKIELSNWYTETLIDLLAITRYCSSKYTRSKVRKALPEEYSYIIEELLYSSVTYKNKRAYYKKITDTLLSLKIIESFIISLSKSIQRFVIDHVHVVGDIFDRGLDADKVMDTICKHHSIDIQWGNHDILWLGGYAGNKACLATLLRIATRYNYLYNLEKSYSLNLRPLFLYADKHYQKNSNFKIIYKNKDYDLENNAILEKVHQAITIIQFKLEGQIMMRNPDFNMPERFLLDKIKQQSITIGNKVYPIQGACFQTVDPKNPYQLTEEEEYIMDSLLYSFQHSERLQRHVHFLLEKGSLYAIYNNNLLFHGCLPMLVNQQFATIYLQRKQYSGKELLDVFEYYIRKGCENQKVHTDYYTDFLWYAWSGKLSPLYGRQHMATFERYFIKDKRTHIEKEDMYYQLREDPSICKKILHTFSLYHKDSKIINGHTPVKEKDGESPIRANNTLIVIDGGLSRNYHQTTGIAGYTLLSNSYGLQIVTHQPFRSIEYFISHFQKDTSIKRVVDKRLQRKYVKDTTIGKKIKEQRKELYNLLTYITKDTL